MDLLDAIRRESEAFYAVAERADPARPVPPCPEWTIADLTWHLADVHWFWATIVEEQLHDPSAADRHAPERPAAHDATVAFGRSCVERLVTVLDGADDATPVWTWAPPHDVGFIRRQQVQEAAVHRWDMQVAAGDGPPDAIDADVAVHSIEQFLAVSLPGNVSEDEPLGGSVHLHCTDTSGEWFIHPDGRVEDIHAKGDVAIRGTASDLLLAMYGRVDAGALEVFGDEALGPAFLGTITIG